jgi:outer membrane protein assembly factor BamA
MLVLAAQAWAQPASSPAPDTRRPAPDPMRGEAADGRTSEDSSAADGALTFPRMLLMPPRLLWKAVSYPLVALIENDERHHVTQKIYYALTSRDGQLGVRPQFSWTLSFAPFFGLAFFDHKLLGPNTAFNVSADMGFASDKLWLLRAHARPTPSRWATQLDLMTEWVLRDDQLYTGIGNNVKAPLMPSRYTIDAFDIDAGVHFVAKPELRFYMGAHFGLRRFGNGRAIGDDPPINDVFCERIGNQCGPKVNEGLVPGFNQGTQFLRGFAGFSLDTRDSPWRPSSGARVDFIADYSHGFGDDTSYFRLRGSMTGIIDLWRRSHILILRVWAETVLPTNDVPVTFSELVTLGGPDDLRGVRPGRFRDYSGTLFTLEYRWPVWMWMDASIFAEAGGVQGIFFQGFNVAQLHPDVGIGVRLRTSSRFLLRLQTAWSPSDGIQFFIAGSVLP